jgi:hypothetical protein
MPRNIMGSEKCPRIYRTAKSVYNDALLDNVC